MKESPPPPPPHYVNIPHIMLPHNNRGEVQKHCLIFVVQQMILPPFPQPEGIMSRFLDDWLLHKVLISFEEKHLSIFEYFIRFTSYESKQFKSSELQMISKYTIYIHCI